jgi:hypothetical protein
MQILEIRTFSYSIERRKVLIKTYHSEVIGKFKVLIW